MWVLDAGTLRFLDVNAAALARYGWSRDQFRARSLFDVVAPEEREALVEGAGDGCARERVWRHRKADGTETMVRSYAEVVLWCGHEAILATLFDVSAQVAVEAELRAAAESMAQARLEAEAANRAKTEFLANLSHEIRTPLNGVVGMAEMLSRSRLVARDREMVEIIRSSAETLEHLLSDTLDLARIEAGQVRMEDEPLHLGEAVRSVAALSRLKADEKGVALTVDVAAAADRWVRGDITRVRQILTNLVSNAVKFTAAGEVGIQASLRPDGVLRLSVRDTGVGFDLSKKEQIFGRFQQADGSITRRFGGTGLGLAITRQLAELMGGSLDCSSRPGAGSVFWVELPLPSCQAPEAPAPATGGDAAWSALRILVADDHPTNRKVVELILADAGAELVAVENGRQAADACREGGFDLILMDMQMPVMDGLTALRLIREQEREQGRSRTPALMLTANALPEHVAAARAAGADGHVSKPVTPTGLLGAIAGVFESEAGNGAGALSA
jgi:signal transduction histidine kinase